MRPSLVLFHIHIISSFLFGYLDSESLGIMPFSSKIMLPVVWLHFSWKAVNEDLVIKMKRQSWQPIARRERQRQVWAI